MVATFAFSPRQIAAAYVLDLLIGDPAQLPHPVRAMGHSIRAAEPVLRGILPRSRWGERAGGTLLTLALGGASASLAAMLHGAANRSHPRAAKVAGVISAASTIATRDLIKEARSVEQALLSGDLPLARKRLSRIVGRDTAELSAAGISRAVIETLAESLCDGIASPLFALAVAGVPGAFFFKAISTLDSTIGHRDAPYTFFGTFAARSDDALNYFPARLAGLALCCLAPLAQATCGGSLRIMVRDGARHKSPNAGYPEAAMAAALGVRLGGDLSYEGVPATTPLLNAEGRVPEIADVTAAIRMTLAASAVLTLKATICAALRASFAMQSTK